MALALVRRPGGAGHRLAGEIDADLHEGTNDRLHVSHLLAGLGELGEASG